MLGAIMGFFRRIFGGKHEEEEYYEEGEEEGFEEEPLDVEPARPRFLSEKAITVKPMNLRSAEDVEQILNEINEGNIVLLRYDDLASEGEEKLKFMVQKLKERILEMGGDLVMIRDRGYPPILIVPRFIEIWRSPD
ncbi:cell division protein SepF [Candidatus Korarchaeum cryptofilum]|uniref:Cell division protein SepF n=2 Tax=Candidatus Korarchaeum cryptofilum TaxID=498846 RepID=A0A3R9QS02_9CREN|nr:cell division protein SepF [Candidatus Korarchaeum cryptofilum]